MQSCAFAPRWLDARTQARRIFDDVSRRRAICRDGNLRTLPRTDSAHDPGSRRGKMVWQARIYVTVLEQSAP